jgi:hypothetical protein
LAWQADSVRVFATVSCVALGDIEVEVGCAPVLVTEDLRLQLSWYVGLEAVYEQPDASGKRTV